MKFSCIICSEYFEPTDDVSGTTCGHIFHHNCLFKWFDQSYSCPQCRKSLKRNKDVIAKLYFDCNENNEVNSSSVLSNQVNDLEAQLAATKNELHEQRSSLLAATLTLSELEKKNKDLETKNARHQLNAETFKVKLDYLTNENKQLNEIKRENDNLKAKIKRYDMIKRLINESSAEIAQMKLEESGGKQWMVACGVLKKALNHANADNLQLKQRIRSLNIEYQQFQRDANSLSKSLRNKVSPSPKSPIVDVTVVSELPAVTEEVASDEPKNVSGKNGCVVKIKASGIVHANRTTGKSSVISISDLNIMKRQRTVSNNGLTTIKRTNSLKIGAGYDGLGGHAKPDLFPTGKRRS
ncbi:hypothetical protein CHUAL_006403 [Chamberlinius hualienensis]